MNKQNLETRDQYFHFMHLQTRWIDNDIYGHINNVTYYSYFDTIVNKFLINSCGFDPHGDKIIGIVVETMCSFKKPISFPDQIDLGLRIGKLGKTSVRYEIGVFREDENEASASGYFIHVFVDRISNQPVTIPDSYRTNLERIQLSI
jgi:acyl-CoA thioester hydrolase